VTEIEIRVLLVCANPRGTDPLRTAQEDRILRESVQLARHRSRIHVETLQAATIDDLRRALLRARYQIVHFSGHGTTEGLVFEDEAGSRMVPSSAALAELLERRQVPTVVLNACYSLSVGRLTSIGTDHTVATTGPISDPAAVEFTRGFYDAIGEGLPIPEAVEEGLSAARLKNFSLDVVLLKRGEVHVGDAREEALDGSASRAPTLVGVALDTSRSMEASIKNETGGALSRLEGAQRAIRRLGRSVQNELARSRPIEIAPAGLSSPPEDTFRMFAYAFGLRHREVADLFSLIRAARTTDVRSEVEQRRSTYASQVKERAAGYGGLADLARRQGFGGLVDSVAGAARAEAERSIRERIVGEVADLLFVRAEAFGDTTLTAAELSDLFADDGLGLEETAIEPLVYGRTPMCGAARAIAERFRRTEGAGDEERRILVVISDGEPTDGDPRDLFNDIRELGVTIVSCFLTDKDVAKPRTLVASPDPSWPDEANLMFAIASSLSEPDSFGGNLVREGWTVEPNAKLFVQINHSEMLDEFVRAAGLDFMQPRSELPEGR
jgi:hypothetical protein